jgi:mevalonate kinase
VSYGVETDTLAAMNHAAVNAGAFGAKLSGAGGGDCMIALAPNAKKKIVEKAISDAGGEVIFVKTNAEGVRVEKSF